MQENVKLNRCEKISKVLSSVDIDLSFVKAKIEELKLKVEKNLKQIEALVHRLLINSLTRLQQEQENKKLAESEKMHRSEVEATKRKVFNYFYLFPDIEAITSWNCTSKRSYN